MIHQLRIYEIFEDTKDAFHAAFAIMSHQLHLLRDCFAAFAMTRMTQAN